MNHKVVRVDNLMYEGCEPHWKCIYCGQYTPFHCYSRGQLETQWCKGPSLKSYMSRVAKMLRVNFDERFKIKAVDPSLRGVDEAVSLTYYLNDGGLHDTDSNIDNAAILSDILRGRYQIVRLKRDEA